MLVWFCHSAFTVAWDVEPWGEAVGAHAGRGLEGILGHLQTHPSADLTPSLEDALWRYQINALTIRHLALTSVLSAGAC